jgi:hypothetical protein
MVVVEPSVRGALGSVVAGVASSVLVISAIV